MAKISTLGRNNPETSPKRVHELDNIDIKGKGPFRMKPWMWAAVAAAGLYFWSNKKA